MTAAPRRPRVICHMISSRALMLEGVEQRADGVLWLRYRVDNP